ncbi:MAG: TIGR00282 family metallophosphoesterase [Selenomonadaceae bacterium]|nr:TIGR00282 family metallophosphoesterase [Selenomonadaceae bacterium]
MRIMFVGDVVGRSGRRLFAKYTPGLKREKKLDLVVVNGENVAGGNGLTKNTLEELYGAGADIVTTGNHVWDKKEVLSFIEQEPYLVRPANYPEPCPGHGFCIYPFKALNIGIMNLSGRTFMPPMDCPFQKAEELLEILQRECDLIFLDFHAEATSEKIAMGRYLDGRITGLVGTHTHVPTSDERVLPQGTGYVTDLGMVGATDSVLGVKTELIIEKFLTGRPVRFDAAEGAGEYAALVMETDDAAGKTKRVERVLIREADG